MKQELQDELYHRYPKIFRQRFLPMTETCMCWGICTGDGWFWLIDRLCATIQARVDHSKGKVKQVEAVQVKEKFGRLRVYINGGDDIVRGWIQFAECLSVSICEECGTTEGTCTNEDGWLKTLCPRCREREMRGVQGTDM